MTYHYELKRKLAPSDNTYYQEVTLYLKNKIVAIYDNYKKDIFEWNERETDIYCLDNFKSEQEIQTFCIQQNLSS